MKIAVETPKPQAPGKYEAPQGTFKKLKWKSGSGKSFDYEVRAEWMLLRKKDKPVAEMFHTYYKLSNTGKTKTSKRPITFVFNGGPGAASAYLHIGGLGPKRVYFEADGNLPAPPAKILNNPDSWLAFTDLVFIDPIGTGFSQVIDEDKILDNNSDKNKKDSKPLVEEKEFFQLKRDLDSLGEFIERFLSQHHLWDVPVMIAGESYGGYRVAKLARLLQEKHGVGLHAAIAISPALEWTLLSFHDYETMTYVDSFCSMAMAAGFHGKSRVFKKGAAASFMKQQIEEFASNEYAVSLIKASTTDQKKTVKTWEKAADYLGIDRELVLRSQGRIRFWRFARELLKEQHKVIGFYDASIIAVDPFPDREMHEAPDPTLIGIERIFAAGINQLLRSEFGLKTDRLYELLSEEVNMSWKRDEQKHVFDTAVGATDDLRFAMSMNPHMKVLITHGLYDMVTPYHSTDRLALQMRLQPEQQKKLFVRHFGGGHMFYTWDKSRTDFTKWVKEVCF